MLPKSYRMSRCWLVLSAVWIGVQGWSTRAEAIELEDYLAQRLWQKGQSVISDSEPLHVRIVIGTFDPLHEGHAQLVDNALAELPRDGVVVVIPTTLSVLQGKRPAPLRHRLAMIAEAYQDDPQVLYIDPQAPLNKRIALEIQIVRRLRRFARKAGFSTHIQVIHGRGGSRTRTRRFLRQAFGWLIAADDVRSQDSDSRLHGQQLRNRLCHLNRETKPDEIREGELGLSPQVMRYILKHDLYRQPGGGFRDAAHRALSWLRQKTNKPNRLVREALATGRPWAHR